MNAPVRIFAEAEKVMAAEVAKSHRVELRARGRYMRGACPLCGRGKNSEAFQAEVKGPLWHCHSCGEGGDAIKLEMLLGGLADRVEAARVLAGAAERIVSERPVRQERAQRNPGFGELVSSDVVAAYIWRTSVPAEGEIVEEWLAARGLNPRGVAGGLQRLRFHPRCPVVPWRVGQDPEDTRTEPAMVARLHRIDPTSLPGERALERCGVHVTYLRPDGRAKAQMRRRDGSEIPARKMWGTAKGAGFWLTQIDVPDGAPLVVGEGIETCWAYLQDLGTPARACAVLSLANLQGGYCRDRSDALPLWNPIADPEKRPMLVRNPGHVVTLIDADMKPIEVSAQRTRGGRREKVQLTSLERAELCAALARQHWRSSGALSVRAVRPRIGMDFNDAAIAAQHGVSA